MRLTHVLTGIAIVCVSAAMVHGFNQGGYAPKTLDGSVVDAAVTNLQGGGIAVVTGDGRSKTVTVTEADTLQAVTARGATSSNSLDLYGPYNNLTYGGGTESFQALQSGLFMSGFNLGRREANNNGASVFGYTGTTSTQIVDAAGASIRGTASSHASLQQISSTGLGSWMGGYMANTGSMRIRANGQGSMMFGYLVDAGEAMLITGDGCGLFGGKGTNSHDYSWGFGYGLTSRETNSLFCRKLYLESGTGVNEISVDGTLAGDSDVAIPTEKAVKAYVDANAGSSFATNSGNFGTYHTNVQTITWAAVSNAWRNAEASPDGGIVDLSSGQYVVPAGANFICATSNVWVRGKGNSTFIDVTTGAQDDDFIDMAAFPNITLSNMRIKGNKSGGTSYGLIYANGAASKNIRLENLLLEDSDHHAVSLNSGAENHIVGVTIRNGDGRGATVSGVNHFGERIVSEDNDEIGINWNCTAGGNLVDCISQDNGGNGIQLATDCMATGCRSKGNTGFGFSLNTRSQAVGCFASDNTAGGATLIGVGATWGDGNMYQNGNTVMIKATANEVSIVGGTLTCGGTDLGVWFDNVDNGHLEGTLIIGADTAPAQVDADCSGVSISIPLIAGEPDVINNQPDAPKTFQLGMTKFSKDSGIQFDATADGMADDSFNGTTLGGLNAGENITQWDLVYLYHADTELHQADADSTNTCHIFGMAVDAGTDGNECVVLIQGVVRNDGWAWVSNGVPLYLSTTAGGIQTNAPSGSGDVVRLVGMTLSDDEILFNVSATWIVVP